MFTFKLRRDPSWDWTSKDPILGDGEPALETDTGWFKIGDGLRNWSQLDYFVPSNPEEAATFAEHINSETPHPVYDDGPSFELLYQNAKV